MKEGVTVTTTIYVSLKHMQTNKYCFLGQVLFYCISSWCLISWYC